MREGLACRLQEGVAAPEGKGAHAIVEDRRTGINAALLNVIIQVPLNVCASVGLNSQAGDQRREAAGDR